MKRNVTPSIKCENCGKLPPIDTEHSNENWTAYKTNVLCECGGVFKLVFDGKK